MLEKSQLLAVFIDVFVKEYLELSRKTNGSVNILRKNIFLFGTFVGNILGGFFLTS